jgi:hypothetical protein
MRSLFKKVKTFKKGIKLNEMRRKIRDKGDNLLTKDSDMLQRCTNTVQVYIKLRYKQMKRF